MKTRLIIMSVAAAAVAILPATGRAQPADPAPPAPEPADPAPSPAQLAISNLQIHGFVSEGGFVSTDNDYIGDSSRGSLALFEGAVNVSTQITDHLRAGLQLFGRNEGTFRDLPPRLDWAYLDYRWRPWLGLRAGIIKMPYGLYNEYEDIDAARTSILMPQSVYSIRNRSALLAQTGFELYGDRELGRSAGSLDYEAWLGTLDIPDNALVLAGATLDDIDTRYVTGARLFWHPPIEGLRLGGTFIRASIDFHLTLDPGTVQALIMNGLVPPDYMGQLVISLRPDMLWIASTEYTREDWLFAAEYSRWYQHQESTLSKLLPAFDADSERFYVLATHRFCPHLEAGAYYSVVYADVNDRHGHNRTKFPEAFEAWQRDAAATLRFDVNEHWLWKLEAHFIDGAADLDLTRNTHPTRYWGMFLARTTVTF